MKITKILILFLCSISFLQAQDTCFVQLDNFTGFELSQSEFDELNQAACDLVDSLPQQYQDSFKVYDFGFYVNNEKMVGGNNLFFKDVKDKIQNSYLLFGSIISNKGNKLLYKFKLPENWLNQCYNSSYINMINTEIKSSINSIIDNFGEEQVSKECQISIIEYFKDKLGEITECCAPNLQNTGCNICISASDLYDHLINSGFKPYTLCDIQNQDSSIDQSCLCFNDFYPAFNSDDQTSGIIQTYLIDSANHNIALNGDTFNIISKLTDYANGIGYNDFTGIVTKNKSFCFSNSINNLNNYFTESDISIWFHIWQNPNNSEEDIILLKTNYNESEIIHEFNLNVLPNDILPDYDYVIHQRSFAPWDRFGDFIFDKTKNAFHGDNRGFSLKKTIIPILNNDPDYVTSRLINSVPLNLKNGVDDENIILISSETRGYRDFIRTTPVFYPESPIEADEIEVEEETDRGSPRGETDFFVKEDLLKVLTSMEGSNPLMFWSPDIEWFLEMHFTYSTNSSLLNVDCFVSGKGFPAYEAFIEDKCGNRLFVHTYTSPSEGQLGKELLYPFHDYEEQFNLSIKVDNNGCFEDEIWINDNYEQISIWNNQNLQKNPADDCPSIPCNGEY